MKRYVKTVWVDNKTPINACNLNKLENGLYEATVNALAASDIIQGPGITLAIVGDKLKISATGSGSGVKIEIITTPQTTYQDDVIYFLIDSTSGILKKIIVRGEETEIPSQEEITAQIQAAIQPKADKTELNAHIENGEIHVTSAEKTSWNNKVDASLVYNKTEVDQKISVVQSGLDNKVDKVEGKTLTDNNYSDSDKLKLMSIESGAQVNTVTSVAGRQGAIVLGITDISGLQDSLNSKVSGTDPRLSDARPASDVYSWAKAETKPTYTASEVGALPDTTVIPTKTSQLTNDSGFLTEHQSLEGYATEVWVESKGYLTSADVSNKEDKLNKVNSWSETVNDTHYPTEKLVKNSIDEVRNVAAGKTKSFIISGETAPDPWNVQDNIITVSLSDIPGVTSLDDIHLGDNILVQALDVPDRWIMSKESSSNIKCSKLETSKVDLTGYQTKITESNKLSATLVSGLSTVATSGSYTDLTNKPNIPTKTSDLVNDSGFITDISGKQDKLVPDGNISIDTTTNKIKALGYTYNSTGKNINFGENSITLGSHTLTEEDLEKLLYLIQTND